MSERGALAQDPPPNPYYDDVCDCAGCTRAGTSGCEIEGLFLAPEPGSSPTITTAYAVSLRDWVADPGCSSKVGRVSKRGDPAAERASRSGTRSRWAGLASNGGGPPASARSSG